MISLENISKVFGGIEVLRGVSLDFPPGTIHGLVGENGAGKSTLGKIIGGAIAPTKGELRVDGASVRLRSPKDAINLGIGLVQQEIVLAKDLSAFANVVLGREAGRLHALAPPRRRKEVAEVAQLCTKYGFRLPLEEPVGRLSLAQQQEVELLRAIRRGQRLVVMDEATAALDRQDAILVLNVARELAQDGVAVVFVSHFLDEVLDLCDQVSVLRNGQLVLTTPVEDTTRDDLIEAMLGHEIDARREREVPPSAMKAEMLRVKFEDGQQTEELFRLAGGEIVALFGLAGSGRSGFLHNVFGSFKEKSHPISVWLDGHRYHNRQPATSSEHGIALLPQSRKDQGLFLGRTVAQNIGLPVLAERTWMGLVGKGNERRYARTVMGKLKMSTMPVDAVTAWLSGGNQQRVLFAKTLAQGPRVLLLDEPTRGVDIGARESIYQMIRDEADRGVGIVVATSDLEEAWDIADRVVVFRQGRIVGEVTPAAGGSRGQVLRLALGAQDVDIGVVVGEALSEQGQTAISEFD